MVFKFQRANRMGNGLDGIANAMRVIIHGVDAPLIAGAVVMHFTDPVDGWITHVHVG